MKTFYITLFILFFLKSANAQELNDCASCSTKVLKPGQIEHLSIDEIRFLTNDLMARKGYKFQNGEVDNYYAQKDWYKPRKNNNEVVPNEIEKQNISLFQNRTIFLKKQREKLISEIEALKKAVLTNNNPELAGRFKYVKAQSDFQFLQKVFAKISVSDINWFKNKAMYEMRIDDGDFVRVYSISIDRNKVLLIYNNEGGSSIDKHGTLYPTDYNNEFAYSWIFEFDDTLRFIKFDVAG